MSKYTFLGLAAILIAAGNAAAAYANGTEEPAAPAGDAGDGGEPAKRPRGRPAGTGTGKTDAGTGTGPTDAERFVSNQALIKPLVDGNQGDDVKKVIAKYSKTGMKDVPAASQADFEKDIAALSY